MWRLVNAKTQSITKKLATEFANLEAAPGDRRLSERRLQVYEKMVRSGNWRPCVWSRAYCKETDGVYRVNGKHTSILFSTLANEFPELVVTVEDYVCDSLEDVGRLYGTFDASMTVRNQRDVNRAFAATVPELNSIADRIIEMCVTGMFLHTVGGTTKDGKRFTPQDRAEMMLEHPDFVCWVASIMPTGGKHSHLTRGGVAAAMFASYCKCKRDAEKFWAAVRDETGDNPKCPDRVLARWLLTTSVNDGSGGHLPKSKKADIREMYVRCLHAWNAFRRGAELSLLKYAADSKIPTCQ